MLDEFGNNIPNGYVDSIAGSPWTNFGFDNHLTYFFDDGGYRAWTSAEKAAFAKALQSWASVANITFSEVTSAAQAELSESLATTRTLSLWYGAGTVAVHTKPSSAGSAGGTFAADGAPGVNEYVLGGVSPAAGSYVFETFVHELGHGLGLGHPHDGNFPGVTGAFDTGDGGLNQNIYTIMSYNEYGAHTTSGGHATGPMAFDIAAIQQMYGANLSYHNGDDIYYVNSMSAAWSCIWDTAGTDTIAYTGKTGVTIDLRAATLKAGEGAGGFITGFSGAAAKQAGGFTIAHGVIIEAADGGSGNDTLIGNAAGNRLQGNGGNDTLNGGAGSDTLFGGAGDDVYRLLDSTNDLVQEAANAGTDTVVTIASASLRDFSYIENLTLAGTTAGTLKGDDARNKLAGNGADNILWGRGGNDELIGGSGLDTLYGGAGNDTYVIGNDKDVVAESAGGGIDTIVASVSFSLADFANIENGTLKGTNWLNVTTLTGNAGNNFLQGDRSMNILDGGAGRDILKGGGDADVYIVDTPFDVIIEAREPANFADEVWTSAFSLDLAHYKNIEGATLLGKKNLSVSGTDAAERLSGNDGKNIVTGGGGSDSLRGGAGADVFKYLAVQDSKTVAADTIADFSYADTIDLSAIDADARAAGNQAFTFIGKGAFSGAAGELRFSIVSYGLPGYGRTTVEADVDGDKHADVLVELTGTFGKLSAADFLL